jgi:hypothetical protein
MRRGKLSFERRVTHFIEEFQTEGSDRSVLGMVGDGPMQQIMILSRDALQAGFSNDTDKRNTAIHEFVFLLLIYFVKFPLIFILQIFVHSFKGLIYFL